MKRRLFQRPAAQRLPTWAELTAMDNLMQAWRKVRANGGGAGIDGQSLLQFESNLEANLRALHRELIEGIYRPQQVLRVYVPKASGGQRPLGVFAVRDRVVQRALHDALAPFYDQRFLDCSFAFREGRSLHDAVAAILRYRDAGRRWVVDGDIKDCFERIDHELLMAILAHDIRESRILDLIRRFLEAKVFNDPEGRLPGFGTAQGGVISPLLCNIYLHAFDERMTEGEPSKALVRYADDWIIQCVSEADAHAALNRAMDGLAKLKLAVNPYRTRITHFEQGFSFLGVFFLRDEHFYISPGVTAPAGSPVAGRAPDAPRR
ncbi:MAG: reverse transcriptase domain-containing protein [Anaerolineae bacterium]|nr:reverse transcriptase domain-containing protein [Candidatus Roseilinea sp.]MDW8449262.1 reverse transcriptase domain-containing protein [Anaerolineae bacterium]